MNRILPIVGLLLLAGCGVESEEALVTDAEIDSIQSSSNALTVASTEAPASAAHVRLAWGFLAGRRNAPEWIDWSGTARIDSGSADIENVTYFERRDIPLPNPDAQTIKWTSHTRPHFDGLVALVNPGAQTDVLHLSLPLLHKDYSAADLAAGVNDRVTVDDAGHEVSVTSLPAGACGGFVFGYLAPSQSGFDAFGGIVTDAAGNRIGRIRFRLEDGQVSARRFVGKNVVATGSGTAEGDSVTAQLTNEDGSAAGSFSATFARPSYGPRGSFQGTWRCAEE